MTDDADLPAIGTHVQVRRQEGNTFRAAIVVGHLNDSMLGSVLELRLSDSERIQRVWPSTEIRLAPGGLSTT
jgi:hypothetical protein